MKAMRKGDKVLFYHSNCDVPGVYGLATVSGEAGPDETQFDKKSHYYEPRATREKPVWECASIKFAKAFKQPVTLSELRLDPQTATMMILEKGSRLSVTPVSEGEFKRVEALGK
jgi:predicted RNA-binding protein with PUA-like domain